MKIVFATGNKDKLREIREIMSDVSDGIFSIKDVGIVIDAEENGESFAENALIKARDAASKITDPDTIVMADDSGLEIDALNKEPGVHSARFMGEDTSYRIKNAELIRRLEGVPDEKRTARFVCCIAAVLPDGRELTAEGTIEGRIGYEERGQNGFGYDPIFYLPDRDVSTAELAPEDKNAISHRGRALRIMRDILRNNRNGEKKMKITLKDGSIKEFDSPLSVIDIAAGISEGLARVATAGEVNGETVDLRTIIDKDCDLSILTCSDTEGLAAYRHTTSHIMAQAIKRLYPAAKLAIGPSIADGFYYDIDIEGGFTPADLEKIEAEMKKIIKEALPLKRFTLPRDEAIAFMKEKEEPYKVELIEDLPEGSEISFYEQGEFTDLCAGPHLMNTKSVKAFKLTSIAGAYWRGSEKNKMLTRIYGTAFAKKSDLEEYLTMIEEAKKRDHRKLGRELGLFMLTDYGPGFPFFLPNGMILKNSLLDYWREIHRRNGYVEISTPIMLNRSLWETSGHWDHYKDNMYTTVIDEEDFAIKPMNCPGSVIVYKSEPRSYRDLPLRFAELGLVHRHEKSGELHGLMRVRCFTQDDAHILLALDQAEEEIKRIAGIIDRLYSLFGFEYHVELSTRPEDSMGSDEDWEMATNALRNALESIGKDYIVNEGDGAFYGPKIDFHLTDCLGRTWQCGTIQLDFQLPQRFECEYTGADGEKHCPIMIHRVVFGSVERFIGILTEHFGGAFPLWLSPVQAIVLPISEKFMDYATKITNELEDAGIRAKLDMRNEKIGYKIREAQTKKIPYMLVVGAKEEENNQVSVRTRKEGDQGMQGIEEFIAAVKEEIKNKVVK